MQRARVIIVVDGEDGPVCFSAIDSVEPLSEESEREAFLRVYSNILTPVDIDKVLEVLFVVDGLRLYSYVPKIDT